MNSSHFNKFESFLRLYCFCWVFLNMFIMKLCNWSYKTSVKFIHLKIISWLLILFIKIVPKLLAHPLRVKELCVFWSHRLETGLKSNLNTFFVKHTKCRSRFPKIRVLNQPYILYRLLLIIFEHSSTFYFSLSSFWSINLLRCR